MSIKYDDRREKVESGFGERYGIRISAVMTFQIAGC